MVARTDIVGMNGHGRMSKICHLRGQHGHEVFSTVVVVGAGGLLE